MIINKCRNCDNKLKNPIHSNKNNAISLWPTNKKYKDICMTLNAYSCEKCNLLQLQRFGQEKVLKFYEGPQYIMEDNKLLKDRYKLIIKKVTKKEFKNKKILEIGGGRNNILKYFQDSKKHINDISIVNKNLKNVKKIPGVFSKKKFKKKYFDYIFFFHTLEHIEDPKLFLKDAYKILKDCGKIIIEVPNSSFYLKNNSSHAFFFQHQSIFDKFTLDNLLSNCNFKKYKDIKKSQKIILTSYQKKFIAENSPKKNEKIKKINYKKIPLKIRQDTKENKKRLSGIKKTKESIGFYGVGGTSLAMLQYLPELKREINFYYDSNPEKHSKYIPLTNKRVRSFSQMQIDKPKILIFNSKLVMNKIKEQYSCKKLILLK